MKVLNHKVGMKDYVKTLLNLKFYNSNQYPKAYKYKII